MAFRVEASDSVLFHIVPDRRQVQLRTEADNSFRRCISSNACDSELGIEIGFHRAVETGPKNLGDRALQLLAVVRVRTEMKLVCATSSALPDVVVKFLFDHHNSQVYVELATTENPALTFTYTGARRFPMIPLNSAVHCVYGEDATIEFGGYSLRLVWYLSKSIEASSRAQTLKARAIREFETRQEPCGDSRPFPKCKPKLKSKSKRPNSEYVDNVRVDIEEPLGKIADGTNGTSVLKARDRRSGNIIAVKRLCLSNNAFDNGTSNMLHREVHTYCSLLPHDHIVNYLGYSKMDTLAPEIYMTLYEGSLAQLDEADIIRQESLVETVLFHMLQALDFLAFHNLCHRDVKPENILYTGYREARWTCHFVLADFGLSKTALTGTTEVGTDMYKAPEVFTGQLIDSKVDVWSLVVSIMKIHPDLTFPEAAHVSNPQAVHRAVQRFGEDFPYYRRMAQVDLDQHASARDVLHARFDGKGVYQRRSRRIKTRTQKGLAK